MIAEKIDKAMVALSEARRNQSQAISDYNAAVTAYENGFLKRAADAVEALTELYRQLDEADTKIHHWAKAIGAAIVDGDATAVSAVTELEEAKRYKEALTVKIAAVENFVIEGDGELYTQCLKAQDDLEATRTAYNAEKRQTEDSIREVVQQLNNMLDDLKSPRNLFISHLKSRKQSVKDYFTETEAAEKAEAAKREAIAKQKKWLEEYREKQEQQPKPTKAKYMTEITPNGIKHKYLDKNGNYCNAPGHCAIID